MSKQSDDRQGSGFFDDVVLSKPRKSSGVKCPKCEHFFIVDRKNKVTKSKSSDVTEGEPASVRSLILMGGGVIVLLIAGFWMYSSNQPASESSNEEQMGVVNENAKMPSDKPLGPKPDFIKAANTASVTEFLTEYFKTRNWQERLPFVRQTPHLKGRMERWYVTHKDEPFTKVAADSKATDAGSFIVVKLHGKQLPSDHIVLEKTSNGYRVDWESFVVYQDQDWAEIQKERPRGSRMIRCMLEPVQNNHKEWTSAKGIRCYKLIHPRTGEIFFGYCNPSQLAADSGELLKKPKGRFTLEIYYPESGAGGIDVMISRIVAKGWVIK